MPSVILVIFSKIRSGPIAVFIPLLLILLFCTKIISPVVNAGKATFKESNAATTNSGEKDNSEKQQELKNDLDDEKMLCEAQQFTLAHISELLPKVSTYLKERYQPTHHFSIISPPPDIDPVFKS